MAGRFRWDAEKVFLVSGLLIIVLGWGSDLIGRLNASAGAGLHGSGDILARVWYTFFGLLFVAGGTGYEQPWRLLNDSKFAKRYLVSLLFIADASFHLYAFTDHIGESVVEALFFAVLAPIQLGFGLLVRSLPERYDPYVLAWPVLLIGLLAAALAVPIWPLSAVEEIYSLTVVSKLTEAMTILALVSLMKDDRTLNWETFKRAAHPIAGR